MFHEIYWYDSFSLLNKVRPEIDFNKRNKKQIHFVKNFMNRSRSFLCVRFDIQFNEIWKIHWSVLKFEIFNLILFIIQMYYNFCCMNKFRICDILAYSIKAISEQLNVNFWQFIETDKRKNNKCISKSLHTLWIKYSDIFV